MSALRRRTRFATPVILVAACGSQKQPPGEKRFPNVTWNVLMGVDMDCRATEPGPNPPPPRAIACPPGMSGTTVFTVGQLASGACGIVPRDCFDERCVKIRTPCPLPAGQKVIHPLSIVWTIERIGDECHAEEGEGHDACPPNLDCNPPEPRIVPCPPGITEAKPIRIAERRDATCAIVPDGCADEACVTDKIGCPTDAR